MGKISNTISLFVLVVALLLVASAPKAEAQMGLGAAECITTYNTTDNGFGIQYVHYKNNCGTTYNGGTNVNIVVMSPSGSWGPSLLYPGQEVSYQLSSGPYRFWACGAPQIPRNPNTNWIPRYTDGYVVCK